MLSRQAGVEVTFRGGQGMVHCYPLLAPMFPEATRAMEEIVTFIKKKFSDQVNVPSGSGSFF